MKEILVVDSVETSLTFAQGRTVTIDKDIREYSSPGIENCDEGRFEQSTVYSFTHRSGARKHIAWSKEVEDALGLPLSTITELQTDKVLLLDQIAILHGRNSGLQKIVDTPLVQRLWLNVKRKFK